ncbi:hypothetical protein HYW61_00250 [candidate division WWE3 bacterium]|nr:hypothetical protein [candidate division WWE3 bacterium]
MPKKYKYFIYSALFALSLWFIPYAEGGERAFIIAVAVLITIVGTLLTQSPRRAWDFFPLLFLPLHLVVGITLSFLFFPNLSVFVRTVTTMGAGGLLYVISLVNNILLVVDEKENAIPLYRAAIAWSQIALVVVAIPYFAGVYKIAYGPHIQNGLIAVSSTLFSLYMIWTLNFEYGVRKTSLFDMLVYAFFVGYLASSAGFMVSFFPTESFLRALFISSVLMSSLSYLQAHLKNAVTKALVMEYTVVIFVFFILVVVFKP